MKFLHVFLGHGVRRLPRVPLVSAWIVCGAGRCVGAGNRQLRQRQRTRHRSAGRRRRRRAGHRAPDRDQRRTARRSPTPKAASAFPTCSVGPYEIDRAAGGIRRRDAPADAHRRRGVRSADHADASRPWLRASRSRRAATVLESGAQPDRRHRLADRSREPAAERAQLPRPRAARARRVADQRRQHAALRRDIGGARAWACRSAASATSRTTSSSTACRPTTMRRG